MSKIYYFGLLHASTYTQRTKKKLKATFTHALLTIFKFVILIDAFLILFLPFITLTFYLFILLVQYVCITSTFPFIIPALLYAFSSSLIHLILHYFFSSLT